MIRPMTPAELLSLPVSVDLVTAARAFGLGRTKAHELARTGQFPCKVLIVGERYRVPRSALLRALGIDPVGDEILPDRAAVG
jgi:Helix-turn-helix domain